MATSRRNNPTAGIILLAVSVALLTAGAVLMASFGSPTSSLPEGYRQFSQGVATALSSLFSHVPFGAFDTGMLVLIVVALVSLCICLWLRRGRALWLGIVSVVLSASFLCVVIIWGLGFYDRPFVSEMYRIEPMTEQSLVEATDYYWDKAAEYAVQLPRDEEGQLVEQDFDELAVIAGKSYEELGADNPVFAGSSDPVKPLTVSRTLARYCGVYGYYSPLTGEALATPGCAEADLPFVMCHSVSHRLGVNTEDEALFAAFMACSSSDDPRFAYSGYLNAFESCYEALALHFPDTAANLVRNADESHKLVLEDRIVADGQYEQYGGLAETIGEAFGSVYTRAFSGKTGADLTDSVAKYLIAYHKHETVW